MNTTFNTMLSLLFAVMLLATAPPASAESVTVEWVDPDRFSDVAETASRTDRERVSILNHLEAFFVQQGSKHISEGRELHLRVTDVDLAGDFELWRSPQLHDVRFVRDIYPARLQFTWELMDADGAVLREGTERLSSFDTYLQPTRVDREQYPYIKEIYRRWLSRTF